MKQLKGKDCSAVSIYAIRGGSRYAASFLGGYSTSDGVVLLLGGRVASASDSSVVE
jgi:hypothetical protein